MIRKWFDKKVLILGLSKSGTAAAKYLNSKGIARHDRDGMIMLCKESEVFWAVGAGISSKIKVTNKPTHIMEVK